MMCGDTTSGFRILLQAGTNIYYNQMCLGMEKTSEGYFCILLCDDTKCWKIVKFNREVR